MTFPFPSEAVSFAEDVNDIDSSSVADDGTVEIPAPRTRKKRSDAGIPRGSRTGDGKPAATRRSKVSDSKLADDLLLPWAAVSRMIAFPMPTVAAVMIERGESTTKALVDISANHPKMRKALEGAGKFGPGTELAQTAIMMAVAFSVDSNRLHPDAPISQLIGVAQLFHAVNGNVVVNAPDPSTDAGTSEPFPTPAPPPNTRYSLSDPRNPMYSFAAQGANLPR